jgi:transcriptional regulator with PAS, ATPase and Fis domain
MRAAESTITTLLEGESGVGKELFAKAIHSVASVLIGLSLR